MKKKAKVLFINKLGGELKLLLGLRKTESEEFWWLPGGGIESEENAYQALLRELEEELILGPKVRADLQIFIRKIESPSTINYSTSNAHYTVFIIPLSEAAVEEEIKIIEEFSELRWFAFSDLPKNLSREFIFTDQLKNL